MMTRGCLIVASMAVLLSVSSFASSTPNYWACTTAKAKALPYCDVSLSFEERVSDLISRLSLAEKVSLISPDPSLGTCNMVTKAVDSIDLPSYMWLVETNTGASSECYPGHPTCVTTFIGPEGLAASFNRSSWFLKGDVISTELRALNNADWYRGQGPQYLIGVDGFGPNINIVRDPRFGRNSELPGEDPFLSGTYAANYVRGIQQVDSKGYVKMLAYLKHYTAYSVETFRGYDTHNISMFDFFDTYLAQYKIAFMEGGASGVMCSYNGENGRPSCANGFILNDVMRGLWGAKDAVVMTDCGAVSNMLHYPANAPNTSYACSWTINNGTDLEAGSTIWTDGMVNTVQLGLVNESRVDLSVYRTQLQLMRTGRFDPVEAVSWTSIPTSAIGSPRHQQISFEAGLQSLVLLKNDKNMLPVKTGQTVAVIGPIANARYSLLSDYFGDVVCPNNTFDCIQSIAEAVMVSNAGGKTLNQTGVDINSTNTGGIAAALAAANSSDVVILCLGIDKSIEHEGVDRTTIDLPGLQVPFADQVFALGKPTVVVLTNGGAVAIDTLIEPATAIVEAFNPAFQAQAVADTLFGKYNRFGKLPYSIYSANYINEFSLFDFNMTKPPGRTYRYYTGSPLFEFGQGLSYTQFWLDCKSAQGLNVTCAVANKGTMAGDEVVMVYHSAGAEIRKQVNHPVPIKSLVDFERVSLMASEMTTVDFTFSDATFALTNNAGKKVVYSGIHYLIFSRGNGVDVQLEFNIG